MSAKPDKPSKRTIILTKLRAAGYHADGAEWVRLYVENRVSYDVAKEQWRAGLKQKAAGMRCTCWRCNESPSQPKQ